MRVRGSGTLAAWWLAKGTAKHDVMCNGFRRSGRRVDRCRLTCVQSMYVHSLTVSCDREEICTDNISVILLYDKQVGFAFVVEYEPSQ